MELAYYNGLLVGSIACRVEPKDDDPKTLYILTLIINFIKIMLKN